MNDDLLVKHLTGEATQAEHALVDAWLTSSEANQHYYDGFVVIWEQSLLLKVNADVNENDAWQLFQQRLQRNIAPVRRVPAYKTVLRLAASVILIGAVGWAGYTVTGLFRVDQVNQLTVQTKNDVMIDTLTDGSIVTVNKRSAIHLPSAFKGKTREITLTGEAFFNIAPDKNKPFIIHTNGIAVTVVGTSFNIRTVNHKTEIIVETGIVKVSNDKLTVRLMPKQKVFADSTVISIKDTAADKLYSYYRSKEFVCDNTPLNRLVEILNEAYDADIIIENKAIENLPITTIFKEEPLQQILAVISETLGVRVDKKPGQYILR